MIPHLVDTHLAPQHRNRALLHKSLMRALNQWESKYTGLTPMRVTGVQASSSKLSFYGFRIEYEDMPVKLYLHRITTQTHFYWKLHYECTHCGLTLSASSGWLSCSACGLNLGEASFSLQAGHMGAQLHEDPARVAQCANFLGEVWDGLRGPLEAESLACLLAYLVQLGLALEPTPNAPGGSNDVRISRMEFA